MLANFSMKVILEMLFLAFSNIYIEFIELGKFIKRFYITVEALPTINKIEFINKREFTNAVLNRNLESFVIYILALKALTIHLSQITQITFLQKD